MALLAQYIHSNQCRHNGLTELPLDKMVAILAEDSFYCIFVNKNDIIPIQISLKYAQALHLPSE